MYLSGDSSVTTALVYVLMEGDLGSSSGELQMHFCCTTGRGTCVIFEVVVLYLLCCIWTPISAGVPTKRQLWCTGNTTLVFPRVEHIICRSVSVYMSKPSCEPKGLTHSLHFLPVVA